MKELRSGHEPRPFDVKIMTSSRNVIIGFGIAVLIGAGTLFQSYVETIREKNASQSAIERERLSIEQAKLNRGLEEDCQKQITLARIRYANVEGGGYDPDLGYCEVGFRDAETGEITRGDIRYAISVK